MLAETKYMVSILLMSLFLASTVRGQTNQTCHWENEKQICLIPIHSKTGTTFNEALHYCQLHYDGTLTTHEFASIRFFTLLYPNAPLHWIGLRNGSGGEWLWNDMSALKDEESNWAASPLLLGKMEKNETAYFCAASMIENTRLVWYQIDCNFVLHHFVCQRPYRQECHHFNFEHECTLIGTRCIAIQEPRYHSGDDPASKECVPQGKPNVSDCFAFPFCLDCKLSKWSEWSEDCGAFNNRVYRIRNITYEFISDVSCRRYSQFEEKNCIDDDNSTCIPDGATSTNPLLNLHNLILFYFTFVLRFH